MNGENPSLLAFPAPNSAADSQPSSLVNILLTIREKNPGTNLHRQRRRLFEVSKKLTLDQIYSQIEQELRNQYTLAYTPARTDAGLAGYHKIQISTEKKAVIVQARDDYYSDGMP